MNTEWRQIPHSDFLDFEASNTGLIRVRSAINGMVGRRRAGELLKQFVLNSGYSAVNITVNRKRTTLLVHRAVAMAFCSGEGPVVNHIDGNKQNNCAENLEWCDMSANVRHAVRAGLYSRKLSAEDLVAIRRMYFEERLTQRTIAAKMGVTDVLISKILVGDLYTEHEGQRKPRGRHTHTNRSYTNQ